MLQPVGIGPNWWVDLSTSVASVVESDVVVTPVPVIVSDMEFQFYVLYPGRCSMLEKVYDTPDHYQYE